MARARSTLLAVVALAVLAACVGDPEPTAISRGTAPRDESGTTSTTRATTSTTDGATTTAPPTDPVADPVLVDGSEVVAPLSEAVAELGEPSFSVEVQGTGSGSGIDLLCRGEIDLAGASRRVTEDERQRCAAEGIGLVGLEIAEGPEGLLLLYVADPSVDRPEVVAYIDLYLSDEGLALVEEVGLTPLEPGRIEATRQAWAAAR